MIPKGPLSPELEKRIVDSIKALFKAENIDADKEHMIVKFAPIMAVAIYDVAGRVKQQYKLSNQESERLALIAMKAAVIQVSIYQELDGNHGN